MVLLADVSAVVNIHSRTSLAGMADAVNGGSRKCARVQMCESPACQLYAVDWLVVASSDDSSKQRNDRLLSTKGPCKWHQDTV